MAVETDTKLRDILSWYKQLKDERLPWEKVWYDIAKFLDPRTESLYQYNSTQGYPQTRTGTYIYDGSPITAHRMLVDGLMGYLISPSLKWFKVRMAKRELEELPGVKGYLEALDMHFANLFQRSNFYTQMPSFLSVGSSIGTATMYRDKNRTEKTFHFITLHPMSVYIGTDSFGRANVVFRVFEMRSRNLLDSFTEDELPREILDEMTRYPERKYKILHAVFPRKQRFVTKIDKTNKKWASFYISLDKSQIIRESGYDSFPYNIWWWYKNTYENYGRSPAYDALVDVMALNQMGKTLLEAAHKSVSPPLNVPGTMKGRLQIKPSGLNYYDNPDEIVRPVELGINYPVGVDREEKKQDIIKRHFRVEFFLMLANATRRMTATEIIERQSEKAALLEAPIARLGTDALNPIFDAIYESEYRAGNLPEIPAALQNFKHEELEIDYTGPLAQAQKRLFKTQGADRSLEKLIPILQINPQVRDNVDWDELAREYMDAENMPQKVIVEKGKVADIRYRRMQALIQQQQIAMAEKQADIANKLGKKVEPDSILAQGQENV